MGFSRDQPCLDLDCQAGASLALQPLPLTFLSLSSPASRSELFSSCSPEFLLSSSTSFCSKCLFFFFFSLFLH